jgi:5'-3' exonuclease
MDRVLIIDSCNFAYKANVIFPAKKKAVEGYEDDAKKEEPVKPEAPPENVVCYNYFRNLRALVDLFSPHKVIDVREGHPAFRYELLPEYKANRIVKTGEAQTKSDISRAKSKARFDAAYPEICRLMKFLPVSSARHPFVEADDTIGSLVEDLKSEDVIVASGDSDLLQLDQLGYKSLRLYHPIKKTMQKAPDYHYLTWKCLRGDPTDNIPRIMSDAKAEALVHDPAALKEWLEKTEENKVRFLANKSVIQLSPVKLDEVEFEDGTPDYERLAVEFKQLDFVSMLEPKYWARFVSTFSAVKFPTPKIEEAK